MTVQAEGKMGFASIVLLGINSIIGSGIFLLPGRVSALAGSSSLFVYVFVTLLVLAIAWCFAQCAALFNQDGGAYIYAKEAFGDFIGFEIGLMRWIVGMIAWAALIVGFVTALSSIWLDALEEPIRSMFILSLIALLALFNIAGIKMLKHLNNVITIAKLVPLLFFVLAGVFYMKQTHFLEISLADWQRGSFGNAALIIFYAFGGFESLVVVAGEMKNPTKYLPIAVMTVISFCSALYFLIQLIAMGILGPALNDSATPLADATEQFLGLPGRWLVTIGMLISIGGVNISASFITSRSAVALAEGGMIPKWIAKRNRLDVPIWAILLTSSFTAFVALSGNFVQLAAISVISRFAQYSSTCIAVMILYQKRGVRVTPLKQSLLIFVPILALSGLFWLIFQATSSQLYGALGALVSGIPLYFMQKRNRKKLIQTTN